MASALMVADVHVFRHEFITQFRYSHRATVHPADMHILEPIADGATLYEEDKGTVFLARDVVARLQKHAMAARARASASAAHHAHPALAMAAARGWRPPAHHHGYAHHPAAHPHHCSSRITMAAARMPRS